MTIPPHPQYTELLNRMGEVQDLLRAAEILGWDQRTMMPPRAVEQRAEQLGTLQRLAHERATSDEVGRLLDGLRSYEASLPHDSDEASIIRMTRRDYEKSRKVPARLVADMKKAEALANEAWVEARRTSDFAAFLPYLRRNVDLKFEYVECFQGAGSAYDILLDDFEPGMKTDDVRAVFDNLKAGLVPLIAAIASRGRPVDTSCLEGDFSEGAQRAFGIDVLEKIGYSADSFRLDSTAHPFCTSASTNDIRLTTRYAATDIRGALFGSMHECGHGLYENGFSPSLERTPVCRGASLAFHESQSRLWENLVGRSRAFWTYFYPRLRQIFPAPFASLDPETFYRAINKVAPSLIRVEADEATYNLHIILRFELEQAIMDRSLKLEDLPDAWNARMKAYLGVDVPNDRLGVLQDVHWSSGAIAYFPTYSLGNIISCQIWERALADMPDLPQQFERGEFLTLREWLRRTIHVHGAKFLPEELLQKVVGGPIDVGPYLRYLTGKYHDIYAIS